MSKESIALKNLSLTTDLGSSELLRQAGWNRAVVFSWCVDYKKPEEPYVGLTTAHANEDILAPAATVTELLAALPGGYNNLHLRINKWDKSSKNKEAGYSMSYCHDNGSAEFLTESESLVEALASMWIWIHSDEPPLAK